MTNTEKIKQELLNKNIVSFEVLKTDINLSWTLTIEKIEDYFISSWNGSTLTQQYSNSIEEIVEWLEVLNNSIYELS